MTFGNRDYSSLSCLEKDESYRLVVNYQTPLSIRKETERTPMK